MLSYRDILMQPSETESHKSFVRSKSPDPKLEKEPPVKQDLPSERTDEEFTKVDNKKKFKRPQLKKSTEIDPNFKSALAEAQKIFLNECKPNDKSSNIIKTSLEHEHNWQGFFLKIDTENDDINFSLLDRDYSFSKKRFLDSKYFQNLVINEYKKSYGDVYLRFLTGKDGSSHKIHIKAST